MWLKGHLNSMQYIAKGIPGHNNAKGTLEHDNANGAQIHIGNHTKVSFFFSFSFYLCNTSLAYFTTQHNWHGEQAQSSIWKKCSSILKP